MVASTSVAAAKTWEKGLTMESESRGIVTPDPSIGPPASPDDVRVRQRLEFLRMLADCIEELERQPDTRRRLPMNEPTALEMARAAANIAAWRSYLPEDCVNAMINDGWQWST